MLSVDNIETYYGASQALFGMSLQINPGEVVTLMGRNGMGKTTTVHSIMGIVPVLSGSINFADKALHNLPSYKIAKLGLGLVPEGRQVFPNLTVEENLLATAANRYNNNEPWDVIKVFAMFPGLSARRTAMGSQLSGGEQQMLAIGRALMTNPRLLILDEVSEGLAPLIRKEIWTCLQGLKRDGLSILVIDKNLQDLTRIGDRHYIIEKGKVVWQGGSEQLRSEQHITQRYLGV